MGEDAAPARIWIAWVAASSLVYGAAGAMHAAFLIANRPITAATAALASGGTIGIALSFALVGVSRCRPTVAMRLVGLGCGLLPVATVAGAILASWLRNILHPPEMAVHICSGHTPPTIEFLQLAVIPCLVPPLVASLCRCPRGVPLALATVTAHATAAILLTKVEERVLGSLPVAWGTPAVYVALHVLTLAQAGALLGLVSSAPVAAWVDTRWSEGLSR